MAVLIINATLKFIKKEITNQYIVEFFSIMITIQLLSLPQNRHSMFASGFKSISKYSLGKWPMFYW